jgi:hypothetical protein
MKLLKLFLDALMGSKQWRDPRKAWSPAVVKLFKRMK